MSTRLFTRPNLVRPVFSQTFRTRPPFGPKRPFSSTNPARSYIGRRILWIAPLAGGIALYLVPHETSPIPALLSSPTIIPCHSKSPLVIESPAEPQQSIRSRIKSLICDWIIEPVLTARRFIFLVIIFMPVILSSPMLLVGRPQKQLEGDRWAAVWWYKFLVRQMARAGPTFIKLAQWAGSRTDLFPPLLCQRLGQLHSSGDPHSFRHTKRVIEGVFKKPFDELFEEFGHEPIGVGAIAQVYRATLKKDLLPPSYLDPKRPVKSGVAALTPAALQKPAPIVPSAAVAIKIKHPKVDQLIGRDLAIISFFAHFVTIFPGMQWLSLPEEVDVFGRIMREQLNLGLEAENLIRFERNFAGRREPVTFPRPLREWSSHEVLIEEFQHALPLESFLRNGGGPYDDPLAQVGLDAFLNMLLLDNFVHSDLHPGNIMVKFAKPSTRRLLRNVFMAAFGRAQPEDDTYTMKDSDRIVDELRTVEKNPVAWRTTLERLHGEGYIPEVVFIDAGLVTELDEQNRDNFLELFRAIAEFDGYRAGHLMVERCRSPELVVEAETFALRIQHMVLDVKRKTFSLGQIKISDVLTGVLKAVREHHVKMEGDFINTVISILLLEGIGRQLDPNLDLFASALPILRQLGRQMSTEKSFAQMPSQNLFSMFKVWVYLEARGFANAAFLDIDDLVYHDRLSPNV